MKTGFVEHFFAALLVAAAGAYFFGAQPALLAFVLGSLAPDIDHPKSIPRRVGRLVFFSVAFLVLLFIGPEAFACSGAACLAFYPAAAAFLAIALLLISEFLMPRHRGKVHTHYAGVVFGAVAFILCTPFMPPLQALLVGASFSAGFAFHLLVDYVGDRI